MLDDISPAVERAIEQARRQAGAGDLCAIELFLALVADDEGRAAQSVADAGGDLSALRRFLAAHPRVPFHMPAVLGSARAAAGERDETMVTGEYLLLGLIRECRELHAPLRRAGVALERLLEPADLPPLTMSEPLNIQPAAETVDAGRIIDANANRAREALRVLEDYCRFVRNDVFLTSEVKSLRHHLVQALELLPPDLLRDARDTPGDPGTQVSGPGEYARASTGETARINMKRFQEAARSLEEFGKVVATRFAAAIEQLRYRAYTLERAVAVADDAHQRLHNVNLYVLLTGAECLAALDWTIREAASGGAAMFQLREKTLSDRAWLERARNVRRWTREVGALFIVNDRPDIARLVEADGVHLGQDDMTVAEARRILGPGALIGVSTHNVDQVRRAVLDGAAYIGIGPTFPSSTKSFAELAGLDFVRAATALTSLPAFAIGGITPDNVAQVVAAGGRRVAVSAAIARADDPRAAAAQITAILQGQSGH